jgi:putative membrane protein insertion efficiency factor
METNPAERPAFYSKLLVILRTVISLPVLLYQKIVSPLVPSRCIYTPTCSEYTRQSIMKHGLLGILLGTARVLRCVGGLYTGGQDPVPERFSFSYLFGSYRKFWNRRNG